MLSIQHSPFQLQILCIIEFEEKQLNHITTHLNI